jgi:hypothetical protein
VEKARKRKVTALKKAILKKRETHLRKKKTREDDTTLKRSKVDEGEDSGFETIDENGVEVKEQAKETEGRET